MATDKTPIDITEAAGDWFDRQSGDRPTQKEREAFVAWLLRSPVHVEEYLRVSALHAELTGALQRHPEWVEASLNEARANVIELPDPPREPAPLAAGPGRRTRRWSAAAAIVGLTTILGWVFWGSQWSGNGDLESITTALGEQRSVLLSDGSTIELNTESSVRIRLTPELREIVLLQGEALFDVAKDPNRPFRVTSDDVVVEAIGTRFNVYRRNDETLVTVVEGRVSVNRESQLSLQTPPTTGSTAKLPVGRVELTAGLQVAVASNDQVIRPTKVSVTKTTAWTERRLVFEDESLEDIVAEFNRYNHSRVLIADPELRARRLTGVFDANDPDEFIAMVSGLEPIDVRRTEDGHRSLTRMAAQRDN